MNSQKSLLAFDTMNEYGLKEIPFLFVFDFELKKPIVVPLHELDPNSIKYTIDDGFLSYGNYDQVLRIQPDFSVKKMPLAFERYQQAFDIVKHNLNFGNSFLTNLTAETPISINCEMQDLLQLTTAKYKIWIKDQLMCFSPETFVKIDKSGTLSSFPMKGTIDASIPNAEEQIMADSKEKYEHTTIVDLLRNDVSRVAEKVWVERFRYIENVKKEDGSELLQVSSEIKGTLNSNWKAELGTIFQKLLPAGSISGAPKAETLAIIKKAEEVTYPLKERGYYTGVFGVFNGEALTSAVMIRFIEKRGDELFFKSGGGITSRSTAKAEYDELISKIYVPLH